MLDRAPRSLGLLVSLAGLSALVSACDGGGSGEASAGAGEGAPPGEAGASPSPSGEADAGPRRPVRRYYMGRTKERCEVYTVEADVIAPRGEAPCPAYIEVGERIRLAGFTCQREGTPGRTQPVVCPGDLLYAERDDREALTRPDAGSDAGPDGSATAAKKKP